MARTIKRTAKRKTAISDSPKMEMTKESSTPAARKKMIMPKYFWPTLIILVVAGLLYLGKSLFVAAMVNGRPISRVNVVKNLEKTGGKQALDNMVTKELITQEAKKQNIVVSDEDVQKEIDNLAKTVQSQGSTLDAALSTQGMTKSDLEENIRLQKTVEMLMASEIKVSDEDVKKYFDENKTTYGKDAKFDDLKESIKKDLEQEKVSTEFQKWYQKLQSESDIKYFVSY